MMAGDTQSEPVTRDEANDAATAKASDTTASQRQYAYRLRRKRAVIEAIGNEAAASRVALLTLLAQDLAALEGRNTPERRIQPARGSVRRILNAIVTRYGIEL